MEARNRRITDWYDSIRRGEIKLPRFQRFEAWDRNRISSLLETVIQNLPLGITLILEVGDEEKFISRYLQTAPETNARVIEHLLDGQQRLTALWRTLHNNYEKETFYVYLEEFDDYEHDEDRENLAVHCQPRWVKKKTDQVYPMWCDEPARCLQRGLIPINLLCPGDIQSEIDNWLTQALAQPGAEDGMESMQRYFETRLKLSERIKDLRSIIANYNLPFLALAAQTDKSVALTVFINMNTNSKPLSQFDIIVAEVESVMGRSLHDLEEDLHEKHPEVTRYAPLSNLILTVSALLQGFIPNQKGAWDMDKRVMVDSWSELERCLSRMAAFLDSEKIFDESRLPTNAVLAPIAALYSSIPTSGDQMGKCELILKKYLWTAFFTDRYENAASTNAFADYRVLKNMMEGAEKPNGEKYTYEDVPIFVNHELSIIEEIAAAEWPKRATIRGRAVLSVLCRLGAFDFSTGEQLNAKNVVDRHYHHVYPDALLKEAEIPSFLAVNCSLIADKTNMSIGRKDPLAYLKDRYEWTTEAIVHERLNSHLIPIEELANGGYEGLSEEAKNEKLKTDFEKFTRKRAALVRAAVDRLIKGRQLSIVDLEGEIQSNTV